MEEEEERFRKMNDAHRSFRNWTHMKQTYHHLATHAPKKEKKLQNRISNEKRLIYKI